MAAEPKTDGMFYDELTPEQRAAVDEMRRTDRELQKGAFLLRGTPIYGTRVIDYQQDGPLAWD